MFGEPQKEHQWLQNLVGDWTYESECVMGPDQPKQKATGTQSVTSLGGFWIIGEGKGEMPGGGDATMHLTIGYDPAKGHYAGSWVGSMMPTLWTYEGKLDDSGKVLTLEAVGPSFAGDGTTATYHDIIELKDAKTYLFRSRVKGEDGTWNEFMTAEYKRVN
jgi:hypothetical protein